jgi:hypothetical protein
MRLDVFGLFPLALLLATVRAMNPLSFLCPFEVQRSVRNTVVRAFLDPAPHHVVLHKPLILRESTRAWLAAECV